MVGLNYSVLAFNSDTRNLLFSRNPSFCSMEAYLDDANTIDDIGIPASEIPKVMGTEAQRIAKEADSLWSAVSERDILISQEQNDRNESCDLTLFPKRLFRTFKVRVLEIKNQDRISSFVVGSLSGLAGGVNLASGKGTDEPVIVGFGMRITPRNSLEGTFLCFGGVANFSNKLVIYTILQDGTKLCYACDVTRQVEESPDPYNVEIELDSLPIPNKVGGTTGVTPGMNDWSVIYIPIDM